MRFAPFLLSSTFALAAASPVAAKQSAATAPFMPAAEVADAPAGFLEMCGRDRVTCAAGNPLAAVEPAADFACTSPTTRLFARWQVPMTVTSQDGMVGGADPLAAAFSTAFPVATLAGCGQRTAAVGTIHFGTAALPVRTHISGGGQGRSGRGLLDAVKAVNSAVNRQIIQVYDIDAVGVDERWQRPDRVARPLGDCEDIAIEKRMRLIESGFAPESLFFAVAFRRDFGLHTVLVARLPEGDWVLDSLTGAVKRWDAASYVWLRRQEPGQPMLWRRVGAPARMAAAETRNTRS
jgi:predicted transglutaminase-like cysteine proteinase